jgi:hypothetical protein
VIVTSDLGSPVRHGGFGLYIVSSREVAELVARFSVKGADLAATRDIDHPVREAVLRRKIA